jgi:hypothetical protein
VRYLIAILFGIIISLTWMSPKENPVALVRHRESASGSIRLIAIRSYVLAPDPPNGKFLSRMVHIFHRVFPRDDFGNPYYEPDSGNTTFHWLNPWPGEENTILIETSAGYRGGTCGRNIVVARFDTLTEKWNVLMDDCGALDSVFDISHNGLLDFTVSYRWNSNVRYIYDGHAFADIPCETELSDTEQIRYILAKREGFQDWFEFAFHMQSVVLDSSKCPFYIANVSMMERCLIHEERPGEFELINVFEDALWLDILQTKHDGMPDVHTPCWNGTNVWYRWNGMKYVEYKRTEPVPET